MVESKIIWCWCQNRMQLGILFRGFKNDLNFESRSKLDLFQWWVEMNVFFAWESNFTRFCVGGRN